MQSPTIRSVGREPKAGKLHQSGAFIFKCLVGVAAVPLGAIFFFMAPIWAYGIVQAIGVSMGAGWGTWLYNLANSGLGWFFQAFYMGGMGLVSIVAGAALMQKLLPWLDYMLGLQEENPFSAWRRWPFRVVRCIGVSIIKTVVWPVALVVVTCGISLLPFVIFGGFFELAFSIGAGWAEGMRSNADSDGVKTLCLVVSTICVIPALVIARCSADTAMVWIDEKLS